MMPAPTYDDAYTFSLFTPLIPSDMKERTSVSPPSLSNTKTSKRRSRSSPTRTVPVEKKLNHCRSPSLSPTRATTEAKPKHYSEVLDSLATKENLNRNCAIGSGEAYFSTRPPIQPLRIVLQGELPPEISAESRMQRLLENIRRMDGDSGIGNTSGVLTEGEGAKIVSVSSVPPMQKDKNKKSSNKKLEEKSCSSSRLVRIILQEIIDTVSVPPSANFSDSSESIQRNNLRPSTKRGVKIVMPTTLGSRNANNQSRCSIAVQALSQTRSISEVSNATAGQSDIPDEWVGGVRALRDSHVRLVLRQLRHINRLNRAIDHARGAPARGLAKPNIRA